MGNSRGSASRAQKIAAVAAAGVVLLGGATITSLAAWTDNEYVVGGFDDQPGIGTSTFEVEQNTIEPAAWAQHEEVEGPYGVVDFGLGALFSSPGASVAGWVQLRTTVDTDVDGTATLEGAFDDDNSSPELFAALTYGAAIVATPADCDVDLVFTGGNTIAAQGSALSRRWCEHLRHHRRRPPDREHLLRRHHGRRRAGHAAGHDDVARVELPLAVGLTFAWIGHTGR